MLKDSKELKKKVSALKTHIKEISRILKFVENAMDRNGDDIQVGPWLISIANYAEKSVIEARALLAWYGEFDTEEIADYKPDRSIQVFVEKTSYGFCVNMPQLLSKRKESPDRVREYYWTYIRPPVEEYFRKYPFHADEYVLAYEHSYSDLGSRFVKDHDNLETKTVTDIVMRCIGTDDHPAHCSVFVHAVTKEPARTYLHIMPKQKFIQYLREGGEYA